MDCSLAKLFGESRRDTGICRNLLLSMKGQVSICSTDGLKAYGYLLYHKMFSTVS